jgi:hypothetical protein
MKINVPINGISSSSSYQDGDMVSLVNLRRKNGSLEPVTPRKTIKTVNEEYDQVFVHQLPASGENWIGVKGGMVYLDTESVQTVLCSVSSLISITQIGNVLNLVDSTGIKHLFWYNGEYKLISTDFDGDQSDINLPAGKIDLRITANYEPPTVYLADSAISGSSSEETVAEVIKGLFAKAISVERKRGYLKGFVLACTAYELFDGSVILHSNPVLIGQSVDARTRYRQSISDYDYINKPVVAYNGQSVGIHMKDGGTYLSPYELDDDNSYQLATGITNAGSGTNTGYLFRAGVQSGIYSYPNPTGDSTTDNYWTYTLGTDLLLSPYQEAYEDYPAGTKFNWFLDTGSGFQDYIVERKALRSPHTIPHPNIVGYFDATSGSNRYPAVISRRSELQVNIEKSIPEALKPLVRSVNVYITQEVLLYKDENYKRISRVSVSGVLDNYLPDLKTDEEIKEELMSQENFYKVKEILPDDIVPGEWTPIDLKDKLGDSLINQERLTVDPFSHHLILPKKQYTYNSRLHIADLKRVLSRGFPMPYFKQTRGEGQFELGGESVISGYYEALIYALVEIKTETGVSKVVRYNLPESNLDVFNLMPLLSYPDARARKITLRREYKGFPPVTERGVCWATHADPTIEDNKLIMGSGTGMFDDNLTGLTKSTTYYLRAYAIAGGVTYYGEGKNFTTQSGVIVLTTSTPSSTTAISASSGGNITNDGGAPVIERGVCWSTSSNPTIANNKTSNGSGNGSFTSSITGLTPETTYYVRAYAINSVGPSYGAQQVFQTLDGVMTIITSPAENISDSSAHLSGEITDFAHTSVVTKGFCYNTAGNPTIADPKISQGYGDSSLIFAVIEELLPETTYYFKAYTTNNFGKTSYSEERSFDTATEMIDVYISIGVYSLDNNYVVIELKDGDGNPIEANCELQVRVRWDGSDTYTLYFDIGETKYLFNAGGITTGHIIVSYDPLTYDNYIYLIDE